MEFIRNNFFFVTNQDYIYSSELNYITNIGGNSFFFGGKK